MLDNISKSQLSHINEYSLQIIQDLPSKALNELMQGYGGDVNNLILEIRNQVSSVMGFSNTLDTEKLQYLEQLELSMDTSLKKLSYNYFKTTVLHNFRQGWRNLEMGNMIQLYPWLGLTAQRASGKSYEVTYALPLWRLYSYDKPKYFQADTIDNHNRKETLLVTNVEKLAIEHTAKVIEEIKFNDILADKLNPNGKANLAATKITTETGSILHTRGLYGFSRGLHTGMVILDDVPDESSLYSKEQRSKVHERVYGTLQPIVEPGGYFVVAGTPFSSVDIYSDLKADPNFKFFEYPAIFPDGRLLAPDRFTFKKLMQIKESIGSIVFAREYLVVPMTSDSSIFPREFLERSIVGMENINFVNSISEYPFKLTRIVLSCDFAIAGKAGSDYSCFMVWGRDVDENFYLLHVWRKQTSSYTEQVNQIVSINQRFKPNKIICESNGFQQIMLDLVKNRGIKNVEPFVTTSKVKKDSYDGVPSLSALFERYQIKMPYAEGETRNMTETIFGEFSSIGYIEDKGKLESTGENDDSVMSSFFAITDLRENTKKYRAHSV
jgi:phage terminase large subunit-like protein